MVGIPPDLGNDYLRELERRQLEEAYQRQGRTRVPSMLWVKRRLGIAPTLFMSNVQLSIGQKLLLLGVGSILLIVLVLVAAWLSPDPLRN